MQVAELAREHDEFVLILPREAGDEEFVRRKAGAELLERIEVTSPHAVASQLELGVHRAFHPHHQGEGLSVVPAMGQDCVLDQPGGVGLGGEGEGRRERYHAIPRVEAPGPIGEESPDFVGSLAREVDGDLVAPGLEPGGDRVPGDQEWVDAEGGDEARVAAESLFPERTFLVVEGRIRHADRLDVGQFEDTLHVLVGPLLGEPAADRGEIVLPGVDSEGLQGGEHAAAGFADRGILDEKGVPKHLRLRRLAGCPELVVRDIEVTEPFSDEVMVDEQLVDTPKQEGTEGRVVEMGMDVPDRGGVDDAGDTGQQGGVGRHGRIVKRPAHPSEARLPTALSGCHVGLVNNLEFDAVVIGGGSAGYAAARTLAAGGARTAVIDGASELGGLCILRGCMPTKALLHAAELRHSIEAARAWGIQAQSVSVDVAALFGRKAGLIAEFAGYRRGQLESGRFVLLRSRARFTDRNTVLLADGRTVRAGHFVIATGSKVAPPPVPALAGIGCLTSDDCVDRARLPKSLAVLGGGAIAVEFAQFFARLGTEVTVIQRSPHLLRDFDPAAAVEVEKAFRREGLVVHTGTRLLDARRTAEGREIVFESTAEPGRSQVVAAEEVLHALGRVPATETLGLGAAGVRLEGGRIWTDAEQRTSAENVLAAGDCCGPHEIVHIAIQQGEIAAHNILRPASPRSMDYRLLMSVVFTEPQLAQVGRSETEARQLGIEVLTASYPFNDHGKSMILGAQEGFVKLVADRKTGEILGGTCVGPQASELIHEIAVAMAARMTAADLARVPHYHPTLAEIWTYPAEELADAVVGK